MTPADRVLCATTARWLSASSGVVGGVGMAAVLMAALLLLARTPLPVLAAAALLLALAERTLALRTRFDAGLFADMARQPEALDLMDNALADLHLREPGAAPRPLAERVVGARRLTLQHALVALAQFSAVTVQLGLMVWGRP